MANSPDPDIRFEPSVGVAPKCDPEYDPKCDPLVLRP
jgi:hypothetical protein